jgi:hypothetical protein
VPSTTNPSPDDPSDDGQLNWREENTNFVVADLVPDGTPHGEKSRADQTPVGVGGEALRIVPLNAP